MMRYVLLFAATLLQAQTATLSGVVKDASGAVISGAIVQAAPSALSERVRTIATDQQGTYRLELSPGTWIVTATAQGFAPEKRPVELHDGASVVVDAELKVASTDASMTVSADDKAAPATAPKPKVTKKKK